MFIYNCGLCWQAPSVLCNQELATAVRKELAMALKDLLQHGLMEVGQSTSLVPFGCFSGKRKDTFEDSGPKMMHAWDLVNKYYDLKVQRFITAF